MHVSLGSEEKMGGGGGDTAGPLSVPVLDSLIWC